VFERGLGSPMAEGLGKRALVRIFYTCQSYFFPLVVRYASVPEKMSLWGDWALQ